MLSKGLHDGAGSRCGRAMPDNAWGYTIEWEWSQFAYICRYKGRDYRHTGESRRVGITDIF
jgi:hypothetical protein